MSYTQVEANVYFAGELYMQGVGNPALNNWQVKSADRVGSVSGFKSYPWGEEKQTTGQNTEKFATYFRDTTGLDYADQRYYASIMGRFLTPDPSAMSSASALVPHSWNRYAYTAGDPINFHDPHGLNMFAGCPAEFEDCGDFGGGGGGGSGSEGGGGGDPCFGMGLLPDGVPAWACYIPIVVLAPGDGGQPPGCPVTTTASFTYACVHRSGLDWQSFTSDLKMDAKLIGKDKDCLAFLSVVYKGAVKTLFLKNITDYFQLASSITPRAPGIYPVAATTGDVDSRATINEADYNGRSVYYRRELIIHELAHMTSAVSPDFNDREASNAINRDVEKNCSKTLNAK
jgi:RHS repeat-associated protein